MPAPRPHPGGCSRGCHRQRRRIELDARTGRQVRRQAAVDVDRDDPRVLGMLRHRAAVVERLLRRHAVGDHAPAVSRPLRAAAKAAVLGDSLQPGPVGMDDVEIDEVQMFPAPVGERQVARSIGRERNPLPVGRPRRPEVSSGPRRQRLAACASADPCVHRSAVPSARVVTKTSCLSVRRERGLIVVRRAVGEAFQAAAVRLDAIQIRRAVALGREDDRRAVGGERGVVVDVGGSTSGRSSLPSAAAMNRPIWPG